jgi:hypothetical protein
VRRLTALWAALAFLALALTGTTTVSAEAFTYDVRANARIDPHEIGAAAASRAEKGDSHQESASPPVEARGTFLIPISRNIATEAGELPGLSASRAQLEAKFKHAADFGVAEGRGASGFDSFGKAVDSFVADSGTVRVVGTYRGSPAILNYNPTTAQVVVQATDGAFVSGWQMSPAQLQNVITNGSLGGG